MPGPSTQGPGIAEVCEGLEHPATGADRSPGNAQVSSLLVDPPENCGDWERSVGSMFPHGPLSLSFLTYKMEIGMSIFWGCEN